MGFCKSCGAKLYENAKFCQMCGQMVNQGEGQMVNQGEGQDILKESVQGQGFGPGINQNFGQYTVPGSGLSRGQGLGLGMGPNTMYGGIFNSNNIFYKEEYRKTDPNAPKIIESRKIVEFETYLYTKDPLTLSQPEMVSFGVKRETGEGSYVLSRNPDERVETDESFMLTLQEIIEENSLVSFNGNDEYKQGVPPEFQAYRMKAIYDSGQVLSFSILGHPTLKWCWDLRKALCNELAKHGVEDMLPPKEDRQVVRFDLKYHDWPRYIMYASIATEEDEPGKQPVHFIKYIYNKETKETEYKEVIIVPDGFYQHISDLVQSTNLRDYSNGQIDLPKEITFDNADKPAIGYCIEGASGRQFNTFVYGDPIPEGLSENANVIRKYLDSLF
ncbi:MAG: zinc ribbon domain-containing protein [Eubacterium sp.]|nr:zinc ribbon domain-containing protein [Eubacterium sp.]